MTALRHKRSRPHPVSYRFAGPVIGRRKLLQNQLARLAYFKRNSAFWYKYTIRCETNRYDCRTEDACDDPGLPKGASLWTI
jgi:hypothetical protein